VGQRQGFLPGLQAVLVGDGVSAGDQVEPGRGGGRRIFSDEQATGGMVGQESGQGVRHGRGGFADAQDGDAFDFIQKIGLTVGYQVAALALDKLTHSRARLDCGNGG
jgi:hypothetical protein